MKYILFSAFLGLGVFWSSCGGVTKEPCEGVNCVNGNCNDGTCDCDEGWEGEFCETQSVPRQIIISKMDLKKFPVDDLGSPWDDEDDGSLADVTVLVKSLLGDLFIPTDIVNQTFENADGTGKYSIPCTVKITDLDAEIVFEIVDYDYDKNFNVVYEFMNSIKTTFRGKHIDFPPVISISSSTGKSQIDLHVSYVF